MEYCAAFQPFSSDRNSDVIESVHDDTTFQQGEASPAQVRFILARLSCQNASLFEQSWQQYASKRKRTGRPVEFTKQTYISHHLYARLNEAVMYCPARPCGVVYGPGSRSGYPLVVDNEDDDDDSEYASVDWGRSRGTW